MPTSMSRRGFLGLLACVCLGPAACGGGDDGTQDVPRTRGCGTADPETGEAIYCAAAGSAMCVCDTGRCARFDMTCASSYRYVDGLAECVGDAEADSLIFSDDGRDFCAAADADADADGGADGDADGDADGAETSTCGNGVIESGEECDGDPPGACTTGCGSVGNQTCGSDCRWSNCVVPDEVCNGVDDDCDTLCDQEFTCCASEVGDCTTSCGSAGTKRCSETCDWGACEAPAETCNGVDDDCDTLCDQEFTCCAGEVGDCTTSCGSTGTRWCSGTCEWGSCEVPAETCNGVDDDCDGLVDDVDDAFRCGDGCCNGGETYCGCPSDCPTVVPPPATPRTRWPWNGDHTGTYRASYALQPTFRWEPTTGGCGTATYEIQVDDTCTTPGFAACSFPSPEASASGVATTEWRPTAVLPVETTTRPLGRRYYWRVRACDGAAGCSAWSAVRYLEVGRVPADFDGDTRSDLAVGASGDGTGIVYVYSSIRDGEEPLPRIVLPPAGQAGALFGYALAALDMDADGFADLAVGEPFRNGIGTHDGRVSLFRGSATGLLSTAGRTWVYYPIGVATGGQLGVSLANAGDVNGDGFDDLIAGAPGIDWGSSVRDVGSAVLYLGSATLPIDRAQVLIPTDPIANQFFGYAVASAGELSGDGRFGVLVGAPLYASGSVSVGRVQMYTGAAAGLSTTASILDPPSSAAGRFGISLACLGDLDDDGYPEFAVGRPDASAPDTRTGQVLVYSVVATGLSTTSPLILSGLAAEEQFGLVIAAGGGVGRLRQRGLLVGTERAASTNGRVDVFSGNPVLRTTPLVTIAPPPGLIHARFGCGVAGALDFDGNGEDDLAVGAMYGGTGGSMVGTAYIYLKPAGIGVPPTTPNITLTNPGAAGAYYGLSLAGGY